jgi:hypothetical protein
MDANISTKGILSFANEGMEEIGTLKQAVAEAKSRVVNRYDSFEKELREKLVGKVAAVTGTTESVERLTQDGYEYSQAFDSLVEAKVVIISVSLTEEWSGDKTPKVWAEHYEAHTRNQRGGGLTFRLLRLTHFELFDES